MRLDSDGFRILLPRDLKVPIIKQKALVDGTVSITRSVNVINTKSKELIGSMEISYLYRNGDLNSTPEIGTIIPKDYKKDENFSVTYN